MSFNLLFSHLTRMYSLFRELSVHLFCVYVILFINLFLAVEHTGTDIKITTDVVMQPDFFGVSETASVVLSLLMQKWLETHLWDS